MNARVVLRVNAGVVLALGMSLLIPLVLSVLYHDGSWESFLLPAAGMLMAAVWGCGRLVFGSYSNRAVEYLSNQDVYLSVTLAWPLAALLGGVPFLVAGTFHSLVDSSFEAMSGFTTTGVHAALRHRSRDALHPLLAQHDPAARWHMDRGALRGGGADARGLPTRA